jgi:ribosomal protein S18 acetylase RimI-like enzyme
MSFVFKPLDKLVAAGEFNCGQSDLNNYLKQYASQDVRRNVARVFVCCPVDEPQRVAGYYTLSASNVQTIDLPTHLAKKLPRYPIPVAFMGRLAVESRFQGQGIGSILLIDACKKLKRAQDFLAVAGLVVDAKDESAVRFYLHFGFVRLGESMWLFLPMDVMPE